MKKKFVVVLLLFLTLFTCSSCVFSDSKIMPAPEWRIKQIKVVNSETMVGVTLEKEQISQLCALCNKTQYDDEYYYLDDYDYMIEVTYKTLFWNSYHLLYVYDQHIYSGYGEMTSIIQPEICLYIQNAYDFCFDKLTKEF